MLMRIVMQLNGLLMALYTQALAWVQVQLWLPAKHLRASFTRLYQNVGNLYLLNLLRVQTASKYSRFRVSLITAAQLIKAGLISAKQTLIQTGSQLVTTARLTLQRVFLHPLQISGKRAVSIKQALLCMSVSKFARILMGNQSTRGGLKSNVTAKQRRPHAPRIPRVKH